MALRFEALQEAILADLRAAFVQPVHEVGIPDAQTVLRNAAGQVEPYIAIQFGDLQPTEPGTRSFSGPRSDDYQQPIYLQAVASEAGIARRLHNKLNDVLLGWGESDTHLVRKRFAGQAWPLIASNMATEAYVQPSSYSIAVQASVAE